MSQDPLSRIWEGEQHEELFIRPSWHVTLATEQNCDALGVTFDPHTNNAIFIFGIVCQDGDVSMARFRPQAWGSDKKWNPFLIVPADDLSQPDIKNKLLCYWISPSLVQAARDLIASEGYAVPRGEEQNDVVTNVSVSIHKGAAMQMAAQTAPKPQQE